MDDITPVPIVEVNPNQHLIAGRGASFGGLVGLTLSVASYALWAYLWAVLAATGIFFIRSGFDVIETVEHTIPLIFHPFIAVPMEVLVVLPYKWIYCPLSRWWAGFSWTIDTWLGDVHVFKGVSEWSDLTETEKQAAMGDWSKANYQDPSYDNKNPAGAKRRNQITADGKKIIADAEYVWQNDPAISKGAGWVQPITVQSYKHSGTANSWSSMWNWNIPTDSAEYIYMNTIMEDIAQPIYDANHGYKPPKYCALPGEPFSEGCDPLKNGLPTTIFSLAYWFCRAPTLKHCTVPCGPSHSSKSP